MIGEAEMTEGVVIGVETTSEVETTGGAEMTGGAGIATGLASSQRYFRYRKKKTTIKNIDLFIYLTLFIYLLYFCFFLLLCFFFWGKVFVKCHRRPRSDDRVCPA